MAQKETDPFAAPGPLNPDRFLAPDPVIVPPDASEAEQLRLAFPVVPPPPGTSAREAWDRLGLGDPE